MAQKTITTTELLSQCITTNTNGLPYVENLNFYKTHKQRLPIIDEVGFRTETDEFNYRQQEYQLRFKFNSRKERRAIKQLVRANEAQYEWKQNAYNLSKVSDVNIDMVNWYFTVEYIKLYAEKALLLADKKAVYLKLLATGTKFDLDNWLSNEEGIMTTAADSLRSINLQNEIIFRLTGGNNGLVMLQFNDWLSLDNLRMQIIKTTQLSNENPVTSVAKINEIKAAAALDLENAKAQKWFNFVQVKYEGNEKNPWQEEISIGASFNIPLPSSNRINRNEAALEVLESRYETQLLTEKKAKKQTQIVNKLNRLFSSYDLLQQFIQNQKLQETYDTYLHGNNNLSPLDFIELKKAMLKQKSKELKIKKEIYLTYIELLTLTGVLIQPPLRNFLTNTQEGL